MISAPSIRSHQPRSHPTEEKLGAAIAAAYEAAIEPSEWHTFLGLYAEAVAASSGITQARNTRSGMIEIVDGWGQPEASVALYRDYYHRIDHWVGAATGFRPGTIMTAGTLCEPKRHLSSEFYNDFLLPCGIHHVNGVLFANDNGRFAFTAMYRSAHKDDFGSTGSQISSLLFPHLRKALDIADRMQGLVAERNNLAESLNLIAQPLILLDSAGRVSFVNAAAEAVVASGDGLSIRRKRLESTDFGVKQMMSALINRARSWYTNPLADAGGMATVHRPSGRAPYTLFVTPLGTRFSDRLTTEPTLAVFITDTDSSTPSAAGRLQTALGLTQAEVQIVGLIVDGLSTAEIADARFVTPGTVRQQIKSILAKTNCRTRADLVRRVLTFNLPIH